MADRLPTRLTPAQQALVLRYAPVARAEAARGYTRCKGRLPDCTEGRDPGGALEELQHVALLALCRAACLYDPTRLSPRGTPVSFASYARKFCRWAVHHVLSEDYHTPLPERADERCEDDVTPQPEVDPVDQERVRALLHYLQHPGWPGAAATALHLATARAIGQDSSAAEIFFEAWGLDRVSERADDPILLGLLSVIRADLRWMLAPLAPDQAPPLPRRQPYQLPLPLPLPPLATAPVIRTPPQRRRPRTRSPWEQLALRGLPLGCLRALPSVSTLPGARGGAPVHGGQTATTTTAAPAPRVAR